MRWLALALAAMVGTAGCTGSTASPTDSPGSDHSSPLGAPRTVELPSGTYRVVECDPVPEQMLDVKVSNAGSTAGLAWAIAGIPSSQGIAVADASGCGPYTLAVNERVSAYTAEAVASEVRALENRFAGVPPPP